MKSLALITTIFLFCFQGVVRPQPSSRESDLSAYGHETLPDEFGTTIAQREELDGRGEVGLRKDEVLNIWDWTKYEDSCTS